MFSTLLTGLLCYAFFTCIQQTLLHVSNNVKKFLQYNINICVLTLVLWKKIYIKGKGNKNDACLWAVWNSNLFCLVYVPRNLEIKISYPSAESWHCEGAMSWYIKKWHWQNKYNIAYPLFNLP